jgi:peroxiredoxin
VELQSRLNEFRANDIAVFAISYDSIATLSGFAAKNQIAYPLLSDAGSAVIKRIGLFNEHVAAQEAALGVELKPHHIGIPYPGTFILNPAGIITDKRFLPVHRERETAAAILSQGFGLEVAGELPSFTTQAGGVAMRAWLDSRTFSFYQRLWLTVDLVPDPGLHIYGDPVPEGFATAAVEVSSPGEEMKVGQAIWTEAVPFRSTGLQETFFVYENRVSCRIPIAFLSREGPQFASIPIRVSYQACSASDCLMPQSIQFTLQVERVPMVPKAE